MGIREGIDVDDRYFEEHAPKAATRGKDYKVIDFGKEKLLPTYGF